MIHFDQVGNGEIMPLDCYLLELQTTSKPRCFIEGVVDIDFSRRNHGDRKLNGNSVSILIRDLGETPVEYKDSDFLLFFLPRYCLEKLPNENKGAPLEVPIINKLPLTPIVR